MLQDLIIHLFFIGYVLNVLMGFGGILTWVERKQAALMSDRIGANRAYIRLPFTNIKLTAIGLFHGIADGLKMLLKEDFKPRCHDNFCYMIAPWVTFMPVLVVFAVIPFGGEFRPGEFFSFIPELANWFGDKTYQMQIANLDAGMLVILAFGGVSAIGALLAGWSSDNKFSVMGAIRAGSQMLSYELMMGISILGIILIHGTVNLVEIVTNQSGIYLGFLPAWGIFVQPFAALLFLVAAMAENKRVPFDLPECESELVSGYFTEYNGMKMGLFMFAEFIEIAVISGLFAVLFLGGANLPYLHNSGFILPGGSEINLPHQLVVIIQLLTFVTKIALLASFQILVRWSLPRFRYDQLLAFAWKFIFPLGLLNLTVTAIVLWFVQK